jgi:hypothetical protein
LNNSHIYFSGAIDKISKSLLKDIQPIESLVITVPGGGGGLDEVNIWMGGNNVTATAHYDAYHNVYVQLYGKKRFRMIAPHNWWNMYCYPRLHPVWIYPHVCAFFVVDFDYSFRAADVMMYRVIVNRNWDHSLIIVMLPMNSLILKAFVSMKLYYHPEMYYYYLLIGFIMLMPLILGRPHIHMSMYSINNSIVQQ